MYEDDGIEQMRRRNALVHRAMSEGREIDRARAQLAAFQSPGVRFDPRAASANPAILLIRMPDPKP